MDKLQTYLKKAQDFTQSYYTKQGNKGIAKAVAVSLGLLYLQHFIRKQNGWLKKKSVAGQHVFITGGASGIGKQMAIKFAKLGALVTIVDINQEALNQAVIQIKQTSNSQNVLGFYCDVSSPESVKAAAQECKKHFNKDVDILINNAGIVSGKKIFENSEQAMQRTMNINTTAHFWTVRQFLPEMINKNHGHVVTIASIAGWVGVRGLADYCASKFGAVGFDESLRFELRAQKSNVKTTCICPYFINTGMFDGVKSKFPLLFPILTEDYASTRIVNAILQNETVVCMPIMVYAAIMTKALFPTCFYDNMMEFFGVSESMDHFKGRQAQVPASL